MNQTSSTFQWKRWVFGWLVRLNYDQTGWWITDSQGYRNTLKLTYMQINDLQGQKAHRIVAWRLMLEWAYPQN
jgi:hypothetical protein